MSRSLDRTALDLPTKVWALENDADEFDQNLNDLKSDLKSIKTMLWALLASVTTASVLLAINLLAGVK